MTKNKNERSIAGNMRYRRFAYRHKYHNDRFGLLEAADYTDARRHLGGEYLIRQTWLTYEETLAEDDRMWEIVSSVIKGHS